MTSEFARHVDLIFLQVLDLIDQISRGDALDPKIVKNRLRAAINSAESHLSQSQEWRLAKYALVAWIDEILSDAPWSGQQWWIENSLEFEFFATHTAYESFYIKANEAAALPDKNAQEVFFLCVVLNFRGLYKNMAEAPMLARDLNLPPDLDTWCKQMAIGIRSGMERRQLPRRGKLSFGAPPLDGKYQFLGATVVTGILLAVLVVLSAYYVSNL